MKNSEKSEITAESIFRQYNNIIFSYLLKNTASRAIAKDMTQDIFLKICLNEDRIREIQDLDNYIFLMARNTLIDHFRKAANEQKYRQSLKEKWFNPIERKIDQLHYEEILGSALNQLSERQKTIYILHRKEGKPLTEVAEELNISFYTAKNHLAEARKNLRQLIDPEMLYILLILSAGI